MVNFRMVVKVKSEFLQKIFIKDIENFQWFLKLSCASCKQVQTNEIYFSLSDEIALKGSRGDANFVMGCQECKKQMSISVLKDSIQEINCEKDSVSLVFAVFDCRGCEPVSWDSKDQLTAQAIDSGTLFDQIDLSDLWSDYDEITQNNVIVESISATFERE